MTRKWHLSVLVVVMLVTSSIVLPASAQEDADPDFRNTWSRTDAPIVLQMTNRTWMWGPGPYSDILIEPYADAPDGERRVQYFDKTRMEINDPGGDRESPWYVTNGLLAYELISGEMQIGDAEFEAREAANVQIAGDQHPDSPTYADLAPLLDWGALPEGAILTQRLHPDGEVNSDASLGNYGATAAYYVPETDHTVASPFWEFMNSRGTIWTGGGMYEEGPLFPNPFFATGFPITEAYWVNVPVAGDWTDVLVQCFERRCLTYTPANDAGWQVEAGNIGLHYYEWRYGETIDESPEPFWPPGIDAPTPPGPPGCVNINTATAEELTQIIHVDEERAQQIIERRPFMYVDSLFRVPGIGEQRLADIHEQGLACV
jgi:hypothetical protein